METTEEVEARLNGIRDRIAHILKEKNLTHRELSLRCGFGPTQLSSILSRLKNRPRAIEVSTLLKIADGGGVPVTWLVFGDAPSH
jgi:transcriptional regulator with XRE-family HTH domain